MTDTKKDHLTLMKRVGDT